jgi:molecular chaperone HscC
MATTVTGEWALGERPKNFRSLHRCATVFKTTEGYLRQSHGREFGAEELSSVMLKSLSQDSTKLLNQPIEKAVITVPPYFTKLQRLATIHFGELAGFHDCRIPDELTAAIAFGQHALRQKRITVVFVLGGGKLLIQYDRYWRLLHIDQYKKP